MVSTVTFTKEAAGHIWSVAAAAPQVIYVELNRLDQLPVEKKTKQNQNNNKKTNINIFFNVCILT